MSDLQAKISARGAASLSDAELLGLLIDDSQTAQSMLDAAGSLAHLAEEPESRLRMVGGAGLRNAQRFLAVAELGRRIAAARAADRVIITSSDDVVELFRPQMKRLDHEEFWVVYLTSSNRIIERQRISQGGVSSTVVDRRLIVKRALELLAAQLILVHNHPSGAAEPSPQDRLLTAGIREATELFDIRVVDHLIISKEGDFSFARAHLL